MTRRRDSRTAADRGAGGVAARASNAGRISYIYKSHEEVKQETDVVSSPAKASNPIPATQDSTVIHTSGPRPARTSEPRSGFPTSVPRPDYSTSGPRPNYSTSGPHPDYSKSGPRPNIPKFGSYQTYKSSGPRQASTSTSPLLTSDTSSSNRQNYSKQNPRRDYASSTTSSNVGEVDNSVVSFTTTNSSTDPKNKELIKKKKKPVKVKISYVTKQVDIQPRYPILTVERLKNLDHHVDTLTVTLGRCPKVYKHGKCVRFVSETQDEYRAIQRYLTKIESQEKIVWCSYSVAPGNSLRVNEKIRVVEVIKIKDELKKLKLDDKATPLDAKQAEADEKDMKPVVKKEKKDTKTTKVAANDEDNSKTKPELNRVKLGATATEDQLSALNQRQNDKKSTQKQRTVKDAPVLNISNGCEGNKKRQSADVMKPVCPANTGNNVRKAPEAATKDIHSPVSKPGPVGDDKKLNFVSVIRTQKMF